MDYTKYQFGVIHSPIDERDYKVSDVIKVKPVTESFPEEFCLNYNGEIKDQGMIGSCVAHSLAYTREITEEKQTSKYNKFSAGYIYGNRDVTDYMGEGMIPREALSCLVKFGDVYYDNFPYNDRYQEVRAKIDLDKDNLTNLAFPNRISTYYRCYSEEDIKYALTNFGAISICIAVYSSFYDIGIDGNYIMKDIDYSKENYYGMHEVTVIGWTKENNMIVLNSWGKEWGDNGKFYISFTNNALVEIWAMTDDVTPPKPQPKTYYRVQVYAFKLRENADKASQKLRDQGIDCCLVYQEGYFKIQCGCFSVIENLNNMVDKLKSLGYSPYILKIIK